MDEIQDVIVIGFDAKGRPIASLPENAYLDDVPEIDDPDRDPITIGEWASMMKKDVEPGSSSSKGRRRKGGRSPSVDEVREMRRATECRDV